MKVFLTQQCLSLTGSLGRGYGYFLVKRKGQFYSVRSKHSVPPDGHWRFIVLCAELAQNKLHITDIRVKREELVKAVEEAGWCLSRFMEDLRPTLNANDVLIFKQKCGL
jgi:hypothetical protein